MTNKKNTKKALLSSVLSLLLCVSMLVGTTFAWFTDEVKSGTNQIVAGNLDVELEYKKVVNGQWSEWDTVQGATEIFNPKALWEPGHVEVVCLKVSNLGSLALKYQLGVNIVSETPGTNVDGEEFKLSDYLVFKVLNYGDQELTTAVNREWAAKVAGTERGLKDYNGTTTPLEVGGSDYLVLIVYMPETVGNEANYRGDAVPIIELGINLYATQVENEYDSYGPDYDENAGHPNFLVTNPDDLNDALANVQDGDVIQFANNITVTSETATTTNGYTDGIVYTGDKSFTIDLNGYTLSDDGSLNDYLIYLKNNGENANEITIKNGAITVNSQVWSAIAVNSASYTQTSVLNLDNVIVTVGNKENWSNDAIRARHGATINLNEGTVINSVGTAYGVTANYTGVLNINSGAKVVQSESGTSGGNYPFSAVSGTGTVNIYEGAVIESDCYGIHNMTTQNPVINIYGGTITAPNALHASTNGAADQSAYINVYNGTINGALSTYSANGHIVITGGTFTVDPSAYLAKGYVTVENNGVWTVAMKEHTVSSVEELTAALAEGGMVTLTQDVTITSSLSVIADTVINGNGATLTYTGSGRAIEIANNADYDVDVTIKNLTVDCSAGYCERGINYNDNGTLTLDNVTVKGNVTYGINLPGKSTGATVVINGGSYSAKIALNVWGANSVVTANNVEFITVDNTDGEGYAAVKLNNAGDVSAENAVININGGSITITGSYCDDTYAVTNATLTGVINISETTEVTGQIVEGYVSVVRYNGTDNFYSHTSLQNSVKCVEEYNSGWVVLLTDITVDSLEVNGDVTIDTNGYTLTVGSYTGSGKLIVDGEVVYGD